MERCDGCEYECDGICTALGQECNEIYFCTVITNRVKDEVSEIHTIGKEKTEVKKKNEEHNIETAEQNKQDKINPAHYKERTSIECIDAMIMTFGAKRTAEYCVQNAYKYVWRYKYKNRLEDLKKAEWYLDKFEELQETYENEFVITGATELRYQAIVTTLKRLVKNGREEIVNVKRN